MLGSLTYRLLPHNELLHLLHLGNMVLIGLQFPLADPFVDPNQHLPGNVLTIVHAWTRDSKWSLGSRNSVWPWAPGWSQLLQFLIQMRIANLSQFPPKTGFPRWLAATVSTGSCCGCSHGTFSVPYNVLLSPPDLG